MKIEGNKVRKDCLGNNVALSKNKLYYYHKDSNILFKTVSMLDAESAKKEFNRVTSSYRGCGNHHPRKKKTIIIHPVIIEL